MLDLTDTIEPLLWIPALCLGYSTLFRYISPRHCTYYSHFVFNVLRFLIVNIIRHGFGTPHDDDSYGVVLTRLGGSAYCLSRSQASYRHRPHADNR